MKREKTMRVRHGKGDERELKKGLEDEKGSGFEQEHTFYVNA